MTKRTRDLCCLSLNWTHMSHPATLVDAFSVEIPTADARSCIRFKVVPTGPAEQAIVVEAVAEGSSAAGAPAGGGFPSGAPTEVAKPQGMAGGRRTLYRCAPAAAIQAVPLQVEAMERTRHTLRCLLC